MTSNEKILMENQINKIFSIIENSDTEEISKIAIETLANKCYDSPFYIFMILKNLLEQTKRGNLKVIQDSKFLIDSIFEDFDSKTIHKILNSEIFSDQIGKILSENNSSQIIFSVDENSNLQLIEQIEKISFNIFDEFDSNKIQNLYSEDGTVNTANSNTNENSGMAFNNFEMQILFPDKDEIREEIESCMNKGKQNGSSGIKDTKLKNKSSEVGIKHKNHPYITKQEKASVNNSNSKTKSNSSPIHRERIKILNFYEQNKNFVDISELFNFPKKRRRLEGSNDSENDTEDKSKFKEIYFNPIYSVINNLLALNSHCNWKTRLCAVTLLTYMQPYITVKEEKVIDADNCNTTCSLLNFYKIEICYDYDCDLKNKALHDACSDLSSIITEAKLPALSMEEIKIIDCMQIDDINSMMIENIISQLIINSIIDKVVDFNSIDYICVYKELNMKLSCILLQSCCTSLELLDSVASTNTSMHMGETVSKYKRPRSKPVEAANSSCLYKFLILMEKILKLLEHYLINYHLYNDWQPIFAILILLKNIFTLNESFTSILRESDLKVRLFNLISNLMKFDSEEILNLTIQILDRLLEKQIILEFVETNKVFEIFTQFLKLIHKYDDIESGVRFYFNCLYNFILFFKSKGSLGNFKSLIQFLEKDLIFFSLNKMDTVRVKYFEVLNNLLDCRELKFSPEFIEKNIFLAFQGICCETEKKIVSNDKQFLCKIILSEEYEASVNIFFWNYKQFLKLFVKSNIKSLKHFFIPSNEKYDAKEMGMIYTANFNNDIEKKIVEKTFERKINNIAPIFSLLVKRKIDFVKNLLNFFKIDLSRNYQIISKKFCLFLKIYFHYLEMIDTNENKILIFNDEILRKLSDNTQLSEMKFYFGKKDILNNFLNAFKIFLDFLKKFKQLENIIEIKKIQEIFKTAGEKFYFNTKEVFEILKILFEKIKNLVKEENLPNIYENFQYFKNRLEILENHSSFEKTRIRGYSAICLFLHNLYSNSKIEKISTFAHPILNCLKISDSKESKIFSRYLIKLLYSVNNWESFGKILFTFLENSLNIFIEENFEKMRRSEWENITQPNTQYQFMPIKYFFKEFSKFEKFSEIQKILSDYKNNLANSTSNTTGKIENEKKLIILIFLLTFINRKVKCIEFNKFYEIFSRKKFFFEEGDGDGGSIYVKLISSVLINYEKIFLDSGNEEEDIEKILNRIFQDIDINLYEDKQFGYENILFLLRILDNLINVEKFLIHSSRYLFEILKFINCKILNLRNLATSIFSKIMRVVTVLKMDRENFTEDGKGEKTSVRSLQFIRNFFDQGDKNHRSNQLNVRLKENLRSYQITAINWMTFLGNYGLGLALCDDMGLGKTIQTLVCVVNASKIYKEQNKRNPINLVVCPNTLILNWINEARKFFYEDEVVLRKIDYEFDIKEKERSILMSRGDSPIEILVTSYEKVRDYESFSNLELFYLVLDEAHIIKNPKTKCYKSITRLNSERRIILTGTPIQNNVMELWALFDFLMPGFLGSENDFEIKFHKKIHSNIKKLNLEEKLQENIFQTSLMEIRKRIKPFLMRRLKQDVLKELPDKIIQDYMCEMTPIQKELYEYWENIYNGKEGSTGDKPTTFSNKENNTLKVIDSLRKICNYPGLLVKDEHLLEFKKIKKETLLNFNSSAKFKALEDLLMSLDFPSDNLVEKSTGNNPSTNNSSMTTNKKTEIADATYNNKVLIFSQYKTMVEKINEMLKENFSSLKILKITSEMSNEVRINTVTRFNSDPSINILILTTNIGGLGLSLTSANIVIMFDHDWNPMKDLQAMDRAHRIGQKKTVEVFRLITADSIEEKLISLQTFKKYIANNVVDQTKIYETKINPNSFMDSLEDFSTNMKKTLKKNKNGKNNINLDEEKFENELIEIEYLKNLLDEKK